MIQDWRTAHRVAHVAAVHAQHDLSIDRSDYVDVFEAIRLADIPLRIEKLPNLFGIYISPASNGPGILLNAGLPLSALRHTAAHELGHHHFKHGDSADRYLDPWDQPARGWNGPEMTAEAFASWFIMPKPAVLSGLQTLGLSRPQTAEDAYQLATLLGASFRGLCRHLANLRLIRPMDAEAWVKVGRGKLRKQLAGPFAGLCRGEVHRLAPTMGDVTIHPYADDIVILPRSPQNWHMLQDVPTGLTRLDTSEQTELQGWHVTPELQAPVDITYFATDDRTDQWTIHIRPVHVRDGIDLGWLEGHQDHYSN